MGHGDEARAVQSRGAHWLCQLHGVFPRWKDVSHRRCKTRRTRRDSILAHCYGDIQMIFRPCRAPKQILQEGIEKTEESFRVSPFASGAESDSFSSHRPVAQSHVGQPVLRLTRSRRSACPQADTERQQRSKKRPQNRMRLKMVDQRIGVHEDEGIRRQISKVHRSSVVVGKSSAGSIAKYSANSVGPFQPMSPAVCSANDSPDWTVIRTRSCSPSGKGRLSRSTPFSYVAST